MEPQNEPKSHRLNEIVVMLLTTVVMLGVYGILQTHFVRDTWRGWWYDEPSEVADLRENLQLTENGKRIFLATQPAVEDAENFNTHCGEHQDEVSLLGCYNGGKIYIYNVTLDILPDSNKATAAHELLHAVWERLSDDERAELRTYLEQVRAENPDWAEQEVSLYNENEQEEELYVRIGTKLTEIPEGLEQHYGQYFQNRAQVVEFYEHHQAPFQKLQDENNELRVEILRLGEEIETQRALYDQKFEALNTEIEYFNECAGVTGCFATQEIFAQERADLEQKRTELENFRLELNAKIERNNELVREYEANRQALGELNDALNSNVEETI